MNGIFNILKPPGMTSQDVVSHVKRITKSRKAGHTGTLDPGAAGVLPVCIGKATRVAQYLLNDKKSYRVEMCIGYRSDTLDRYGDVEALNTPIVDEDHIHKAFQKYMGEIEQIPPMYSAIKHKGVKLYELARKGITVERKPRRIYIYDIKIINVHENNVLFDVTCSKGTYIRSLCSDVGKSLGSDAIMTFLLRTMTGPFIIDNALTLNELESTVREGEMETVLSPTYSALEGYERVYIDKSLSEKVKNGVGFTIDYDMKYESGTYDDIILIFDSSSDFLAIGNRDKDTGYVKIDKVFA